VPRLREGKGGRRPKLETKALLIDLNIDLS
jgi:hypothetical protein